MNLQNLGAVCLALPLCLAGQSGEPLQLHVVQSNGLVHPGGTRSAAALTVEVTNEAGKPVEGAVVSFRLPASGPGGVFATGINTDIVITGPDGRASVSGVRWNRVPGSFDIRITAAKGQLRATTAVPQRVLAMRGDSQALMVASGSGRSRLKFTLIMAGVAAGAVVAGLAVARRGSSGPPPSQTVSLGTPTISVGSP